MNLPSNYLTDKDIELLRPIGSNFKRVVGDPRELYVRVTPKGLKVFFIRYKNELGRESMISLGEFRRGIFGAQQARKKAKSLLYEISIGNDPGSCAKKPMFERYFDEYCRIKEQAVSFGYLQKIIYRQNKYMLPSLGALDVRKITATQLREILSALFNKNNPRTCRLETICRLIGELKGIFDLAVRDRVINYNPAFMLQKDFPSVKRFKANMGVDMHFPALIKTELLAEFIRDLKCDNAMELQTKRALYLQILTVNRPSNTVEAKWRDIDLEHGKWIIPASEMKTGQRHEVALSTYAIKILKQQRLFSGGFKYVFPASLISNLHLHRDTLSKAIRNLSEPNKYNGVATPHGFRATFKTICSLNSTELQALGVSEKVVEECLAHKESDDVIRSYERQRATWEAKRKLMQWYGDYLNAIEDLGID